MIRQCAITGAMTKRGNNVSHANNKTKRNFRANIHTQKFVVEGLGVRTLKICPRGQRTIVKAGGLLEFLKTSPKRKLTPVALKMKSQLQKKSAKVSMRIGS